MNDFLAGGHAEIGFNLFYTGLKRKKRKKPFLIWEALMALIDFLFFFFPVNKGKFKETLPESAVDI